MERSLQDLTSPPTNNSYIPCNRDLHLSLFFISSASDLPQAVRACDGDSVITERKPWSSSVAARSSGVCIVCGS